MSTILGNPITLGGGGAKLNIDFGTTPPSDTSKLWVPLASKPKYVKVDFRSDIGSIVQEHHPVTNAFMTDGMSICETPNYIYTFGSKSSAYIWVSKKVYRIDKTTYAQTDITSQITLPAYPGGMAPCVYYNNCIYIISGHSSYTTQKYMRHAQIMKVDLATNTATVVYNNEDTGSANYEAWANVDAFLWGDKIVIAGGATNYYEVGYNNPGCAFVRIFDTSTNGIERYICPVDNVQAMYHTKDKVIFAVAGGATLYEFDLNTKQFTQKTSTSGELYNGSPYRRYLIGETPYQIGVNSPTLLKEYHPEDYSETVAATLSTGPNTQLGASSYANHLSWFSNAGVLYTNFNFALDEGHLLVNTDYTDDVWEAVKGKDVSLFTCPLAVYLGDASGTAQKQTAYLYDKTDNKWKTLDGVSYTADMLNALNIMGVT